jgi:two-component system, OmpR family, response regulator
MSSVLAIDDEPDMLRLIQRGLSRDGHTVTACSDGAEGLRLARRSAPNVVVLDLMMPRVDGWEVLNALAHDAVLPPVIVLSGVADMPTRVNCLEAGACDFLVKPFPMMELRARVHAHTRAYGSQWSGGRVVVGRLALDPVERTLRVDGRLVPLTSREFHLLAHLMAKPDVCCTREELLAKVWGYQFDPGTNVVDACVRRLRAKIGQDSIETVRNVGYRLASI